MDPFHLSLAMVPVAVYLLLIGGIQCGHRPFVTTGTRDTIALAIALLGLAIVGPLQLFAPVVIPQETRTFLGPWIWLPLIALYLLTGLLIALLMRPRLIVYNMGVDNLRPLLEEVASQLDRERRWSGTSLGLPNLGVQATIEPVPSLRHVQLVSAGSEQDLNGWRRLELGLKRSLETVPADPRARWLGFALIGSGLLIGATVTLGLVQRPQAVAQAIDQFLERH
jgi:hypothetical protein